METVSCVLCGGVRSELEFQKWGMNIVRCLGCGLVFVNPRQILVEDDSYFRDAYLASIEEDGDLKPSARYLYTQILTHLGTLLSSARLLDVGCAMGHFMSFAKTYGWSVFGVECSGFAAAYGRERWGLPIKTACDILEADLPGNFFDACVLIEVIEHLPNPMRVLSEVFRVLKPGGVIYVTTPNFGSYRALAQREHWHAVIPTGHLYYFTPATLGAAFRANGFHPLVDLTSSADFDTEIEDCPKETRLPDDKLVLLRATCRSEDSSQIFNGRGEHLAMCAFKPSGNTTLLSASRRFIDAMPDLEGRLIAGSGDSAEDRKVYIVEGGKKHWITSTAWLERRGRSLSETVQVDSRLLASLISGEPVG